MPRSNRPQTMRYNMGLMGSLNASNRRSLSPAASLMSSLSPELRNSQLLQPSKHFDFVKEYEQKKSDFDRDFDHHVKELKEMEDEMQRINQEVEQLSLRNDDLIERIFQNSVEFESVEKDQELWEGGNGMRIRELFKMFDDDGDGQLKERELKIGFEKLGKEFSDEEITEMMQKADDNRNGFVDYGEFVTLFLANVVAA